MNYIAIFFTHSGAIKYKNFLSKNNIKFQLMPAPRKLSSNCSLSIKFSYSGIVNELISNDIEKLFKIEKGNYIALYCAK